MHCSEREYFEPPLLQSTKYPVIEWHFWFPKKMQMFSFHNFFFRHVEDIFGYDDDLDQRGQYTEKLLQTFLNFF